MVAAVQLKDLSPTSSAHCGPIAVSTIAASIEDILIVLQLEGFGSAGLLTAAEEKKLGRQLQALIVLETRREEATERLGRQISSSEWMAECSITDAKVFKRTIKVSSIDDLV